MAAGSRGTVVGAVMAGLLWDGCGLGRWHYRRIAAGAVWAWMH
jgi:hypothetical protein